MEKTITPCSNMRLAATNVDAFIHAHSLSLFHDFSITTKRRSSWMEFELSQGRHAYNCFLEVYMIDIHLIFGPSRPEHNESPQIIRVKAKTAV